MLTDTGECSREINFTETYKYNCETSDGERGICAPLTDCNDILSRLKSNQRLSTRSKCRRREVCCPIINVKSDTNQENKNLSFKFEKKSKLPEHCGNRSFDVLGIVGGETVLPGTWPWIAALFIDGLGYQCGATLITDQVIITAAHCVVNKGKVMNSSQFMIRLGEHNITAKTEDDAEEDFRVSQIIVHQHYNRITVKNDIAIMKLEKKVKLNRRIFPICLPFNKNSSVFGKYGSIAGWGRLQYDGNTSDVLQEANVFITTQEKCKNAWKRSPVKITDEYLCVGTEDSTKDSCLGDSGGPFMQSDSYVHYITGIISFGKKCATPGYPGVYTRVSKYLHWITDNL